MSASTWNIDTAAQALLDAEATRTARQPITDGWPELDLDTAYQIQDALIRQKVESRQTIVGVKLGLTSRPKQVAMGIDSPLTAWLTDAMSLPAGAAVPLRELIHPRAEPEIAFVLGRDITGPGVTAPQALDAVDAVVAGIEIIDSRYRDFKFTLPDVIADNASSSRFFLGGRVCGPRDIDLALEACVLRVNGEVVDTATGAAVQGHPAEALSLAANALGRRGITMKAGWVVLTGGVTDAVFVKPGEQITVEFTNLGTIAIAGD